MMDKSGRSIIGREWFPYFSMVLFLFVVLWPVWGETQQTSKAGREQELAKLIEGAKTEGKVVWQDTLKNEEAKPIVEAFQKKYPFLKVEHTRTHGTESRERILREMLAGTVKVDVLDVGGEQIAEFKKGRLLEKYDWTKAFDVRPEQLNPDQMSLNIGASVKGVGYNTKVVSQKDLPKTWEDLLNPKWRGKLVVDTRPKSFLQLMPAWGEERVYEYLKKLVVNKPIFRRGQTESIELMAAGEFPIIAGTPRHSILLVKQKGAPVDFLFLDPVPVSLEDQTIVKGSPHPNAAKLLLGWLATEGQKYHDAMTSRGIPLAGFDTESAKAAKGKTLSLFIGDWGDREADLQAKALKAMGRE